MKVEYGQLFPHDNKEDENLQLEGQGGSRSNQTKTKVGAMFLKLYATMRCKTYLSGLWHTPSLATSSTRSCSSASPSQDSRSS